MKLRTLRIVNFRSCADVTVEFDDYTCLVGPNGAGKSTVLAALNILFRHAAGSSTPVALLTQEDFCERNTASPITITATFADLSVAEKDDFKAYVRHSQLVVSARAEWDAGENQAAVKQFGSRLVMKAFAQWFAAAAGDAKVAELRQIYGPLVDSHLGLPKVSTRGDMEEALRGYEESNADSCELVESEDQFYGWSKGENRLRRHIQWVFIPAVKDANSEQSEGKNTALGELLQRTIRTKLDFDTPLNELKQAANTQYQKLLADQQVTLSGVSSALQQRLRDWAHPGAKLQLEWQFDPDKSVVVANPAAKAAIGEGDFIGEVSRLGHGLQRAFVVTLLQELAVGEGSNAPVLVLGFEEPELYQHPPQARHLAAVLEKLSGTQAQVVVATHSPYFVSGHGFESVRMIRKPANTDRTVCTQLTMGRLSEVLAESLGEAPASGSVMMAAIEQILQPSQSELVFCGCPVIVEGLEDVAFLATYMQLGTRSTDFRRLGCHFVIAGGKTNLSRPLAIANELAIPAFVMFDGDNNQDKPKEIKRNRRDNSCILKLSGQAYADPLSKTAIWGPRVIMWPTQIAEAVIGEIGVATWEAAEADAKSAYGLLDVKRKSGLLIAATLEVLWKTGAKSALLGRACEAIIAFASGAEKMSTSAAPVDAVPVTLDNKVTRGI